MTDVGGGETAAAAVPFREARFMPVDLDIDRRRDGAIVIRSNIPIGDYECNVPRVVLDRCAIEGDKPALAWRGADGAWATRSYREIGRDIEGAAQWMIDHLPRGSTFVLMAANSLEAAVLTFAALAAGVILCPIGTAYGMTGGDLARLRHVFAKTAPAAIYADANPTLAKAVEAVSGPDVTIVAADAGLYTRAATPYADLVGTPPTAAVEERIASLDVEAVAAYMLTSGSTGLPKAVQLSLANLATNTAQGLASIGKAAGWDDVMLDWLPWHHAAGASVLRAGMMEGGTIYIDGGKPAPGLFDESIRNLREISVPYFNNVPLGFTMLVDAMERDPVLRRTFFAKLRLMLYGGAGLPQHVLDRLQALAVAETGHRIHMTTGYGMTEATSGCMVIHYPTDQVGIGLPAPGLEVKLVPYDARYEVRLRGRNVMRGYLDEPAKNAEAFDDEGFYRTGDLAIFHDPERPELGLAFAGRLAEEFKLAGGTWVYGSRIREALLKALNPLVSDMVLCDDSREYLALLVWPKPGAPVDVLDQIAARLKDFNRTQTGGSAKVQRVALLTTPPNVDAHEISDKGTINRRAVLDHRADAVERLYAPVPGNDVREVG